MDKNFNIGVIGCGWLGYKAAKKLLSFTNSISCITSSPNRIEDFSSFGIDATVLDLNGNDDAALFDWLEFKDVILVSISPSKLNHYTDVITKVGKMLNGDQKMVFISSTSVYDNSLDIVDEMSATSASKRSGTTLIDTEKNLYKILQKNLTIIRMGGLVGGNRQPAKYFAGKKEVEGGNERINFIHKEDAAYLITYVITHDIFGEIINGVCGGYPLKKDYYPFALKALKLEPVEFKPVKSGTSFGKIVSNFKSIQLGMVYKYDHPMKFPELIEF